MFPIGQTHRGHRPGPRKWFAALLAAAMAVTSYATALPSNQSTIDGANKAKIVDQYGKLPLSFEKNRGQSAAEVQYLSHGTGYSIFFTPSEVLMSLKAAAASGGSQAIRMHFDGANRNATISAGRPLPGKTNYFIGKDPQKWLTGVPQSAQIKYEGLYPGIDLVYYGNQRQLEYDFVIAPHANPEVIRLSFGGVDRLTIDQNGDLVLKTRAGALKQQKPLVYQEVDGARKAIDGKYVRTGKSQVGFKVAAYDRGKPLIMDPVLVYSALGGGNGGDTPFGIAVDFGGSAYITGATTSTNFTTPPLPGANKVFVAKLNAAGTQFDYVTLIGGNGSDNGNAIAIDSAGNAYITGDTTSTNFPATDPTPATAGGLREAFVAKLNSSGSALAYNVFLRGSSDDIGNGIAVDPAGTSVVVTGSTSSPDFFTKTPLQALLNNGVGGGSGDAFVAKLVGATGAVTFSTYLGGTVAEVGTALAMDGSGTVYVTGFTSSTDVPTPGATPILRGPLGGTADVFIAKINSAGTAFEYFTYIGGTGDDKSAAIAIDGAGNAYVTGHAVAGFFTTPAAPNVTPSGGDAFVTKFDSTTGIPTFSTLLGGPSNEFGRGIAVDASANIHVTGYTLAAGGFPTTGVTQLASGVGVDAFYVKYNSAGVVVYSTVFGGNSDDVAVGIGLDGTGNAYITGSSLSPDFPFVTDLRPGGPVGGGFNEVFAVKIGAVPIVTTTTLTSSSVTPAVGASIILTATVGGGTSPLGTVTFVEGTTLLGTGPVALSGTSATLSTATLAQGMHTIRATYNGDGTNVASTSAAVTVTVGAASSGGGGSGGCTVNRVGAADWTLLLMFAAAGLYRLRRSRQRI